MKLENAPFFQAQCVWDNDTRTVNQYRLFRQTFVLERQPEDAVLYISADSHYAAFCNGCWLPAQQYPDYPFYKVYDAVALPAGCLRAGENRLDILGYCQNEDSSTYRKGAPGVIFSLVVDGVPRAVSGPDTLCTDHTGFVSGPVEKISGQLSYAFRYDYETLPNEADWYPVRTQLPAARYFPRPVEQLEVGAPVPARIQAQGVLYLPDKPAASGERIAAAFLRNLPTDGSTEQLPAENGIRLSAAGTDGVFVIVDMLREQAGFLLVEWESDRPFSLDIGFGEHLEDMRVRTAVGGRNFAFSCRLPAGRQRLFYPIKRIGARYLQLHAYTDTLILYYAGVRPVTYPVRRKAPPAGLDGLRRRIYDTAVHTLQLCMHEHYEDCPWREQALYAMDGRNQMLCGFAAFEGTEAYARENLRLLALGQRADGFLELCAPARVDTCIPSFSLIWVIALGEYVEHTGDRAFAAEMQPTVHRLLEAFRRHMRGGLLYNPPGFWNFYEWVPLLDGVNDECTQQITREEEADAPLNAFFALALRHAERLARLCGDTAQADSMSDEYRAVKDAYTPAFWREEERAFCLSTAENCRGVFPMLVQALTVCADLGTAVQQQDLIRRMAAGAFSPDTTLSHRLFYYQALLRNVALRQTVLEDIDRRWGDMLFSGATSFWETAEGAPAFGRAGSLCHGWSAVPLYVYRQLFPEHSE